MSINLLDLDGEGLAAFVASLDEKPFRARQVKRWMHRLGESDFSRMSDIAKPLREKLARTACVSPPRIVSDSLARDGTRKWLLDVGKGNAVDAVFIPETNRGTLCISTQAGCTLACQFCSTGRQGFNRNLSVSEIIGQLWLANRELGATPGGERVISNVVLMGMGEPLLNFDNTVSALKLMIDEDAYGLSRRRVTLSTSGIVPMIDRLAAECPVALAVSLHAPNDALRDARLHYLRIRHARRRQRRRGARTPAHRFGFAGAVQDQPDSVQSVPELGLRALPAPSDRTVQRGARRIRDRHNHPQDARGRNRRRVRTTGRKDP